MRALLLVSVAVLVACVAVTAEEAVASPVAAVAVEDVHDAFEGLDDHDDIDMEGFFRALFADDDEEDDSDREGRSSFREGEVVLPADGAAALSDAEPAAAVAADGGENRAVSDPATIAKYNSFIDVFLRRLNSQLRSKSDPITVRLVKGGQEKGNKSGNKGGKKGKPSSGKRGTGGKNKNNKGVRKGNQKKKGSRHPKDLNLDHLEEEGDHDATLLAGEESRDARELHITLIDEVDDDSDEDEDALRRRKRDTVEASEDVEGRAMSAAALRRAAQKKVRNSFKPNQKKRNSPNVQQNKKKNKVGNNKPGNNKPKRSNNNRNNKNRKNKNRRNSKSPKKNNKNNNKRGQNKNNKPRVKGQRSATDGADKKLKAGLKLKNKMNKIKNQGKRLTKASITGFSTLMRTGPVVITQKGDTQRITSDFKLGPVSAEIERRFGSGPTAVLKTARSTASSMTGKLIIEVTKNGRARIRKLKILAPKNVKVDGSLAKPGKKGRDNFMKHSIKRVTPQINKKLLIAAREVLESTSNAVKG